MKVLKNGVAMLVRRVVVGGQEVSKIMYHGKQIYPDNTSRVRSITLDMSPLTLRGMSALWLKAQDACADKVSPNQYMSAIVAKVVFDVNYSRGSLPLLSIENGVMTWPTSQDAPLRQAVKVGDTVSVTVKLEAASSPALQSKGSLEVEPYYRGVGARFLVRMNLPYHVVVWATLPFSITGKQSGITYYDAGMNISKHHGPTTAGGEIILVGTNVIVCTGTVSVSYASSISDIDLRDTSLVLRNKDDWAPSEGFSFFFSAYYPPVFETIDLKIVKID